MDLGLFAQAITPSTRVVIPTHLFGYPMDTEQVDEIIQNAEEKFGHKIWIIQDCAHSFDAKFNGKSVINEGDGAIFGLGISKQITSIFGGMFTTNDESLAKKIREYRDSNFRKTLFSKSIQRYLYLLAAYLAFQPFIYRIVYWLQEKTPYLDTLTKAYHLDEKIHFPPDHLDLMTNIEALVGIEQLKKYAYIRSRRIEIAEKYFHTLQLPDGFVLPPKIEGATYSHFVVRTSSRDRLLKSAASQGVQLGQLIEYSMPHHPAYTRFAKGKQFPNSLLCSNSMINLPIYPDLSNIDLKEIIKQLNNWEH
jgi:dTDP-4-amino-4,6-dideoxygalactose transaminase